MRSCPDLRGAGAHAAGAPLQATLEQVPRGGNSIRCDARTWLASMSMPGSTSQMARPYTPSPTAAPDPPHLPCLAAEGLRQGACWRGFAPTPAHWLEWRWKGGLLHSRLQVLCTPCRASAGVGGRRNILPQSFTKINRTVSISCNFFFRKPISKEL
jgi:hypothetical protein